MTSPSTIDGLDDLVRLSNLVGRDLRLVQPGGGNSSIKLDTTDANGHTVRTLLVKGSGTDMRTIGASGFSRLSLEKLGGLRGVPSMSDQEMMRFMADCALGEGPAPSVETPLHSILPHRVIVHTHDVLTMSLTNLREELARRLVEEAFEGQIVYVPYARPGFPLAKLVDEMADTIPAGARGLALAHHGLVVFGESVGEVEEFIEGARGRMGAWARGRVGASERGGGSGRAGASAVGRLDASARGAMLASVRGALSGQERVILHFDDSDATIAAIDAVGAGVTERGVGTPEHILRAGRRALRLEIDAGDSAEAVATAVRTQVAREREAYEAYHRRHAAPDEPPIADWAKVVLVPGIGMITAFKDKKSAVTANLCYGATLESMARSEELGGFEFITEAEQFEFEHWPLERRKIEEEIVRERQAQPLARHVVVIIGGGSGIGEAAAMRFAEAGAHVVVADVSESAATQVAVGVGKRFAGRAISATVDVTQDGSIETLFERAVREFGGVDTLFFSAGLAPRFAPIVELTREDLQRQLDVHYIGAVRAMGAAARVMKLQGRGGSIVLSVSKAALAPGKDAAAYGGSKAALLQAMRVAALELGPDGIRANAINADQVDTPLFRRFVEERAAGKGISTEEQLEVYRARNAMGASLIPADAVADLAVLLAGEKFRFTTGAVLTIDGGLAEGFVR